MGGTDIEFGASVIEKKENEYLIVGSHSSLNGDVAANFEGFDSWILDLIVE